MKQRALFILLGTFAALPLCGHAAANVSFSSGNFTSDGQHLTTGKNGHAQVGVDAQGSLIRLGSNTVADLGAEGGINLQKGLLLVSSGEGFLRRTGIVIQTAEGQITVRGTALVAMLPDGAVKLTCLEGGVRGSLGGQGVSLHPGELIIHRHDGSRDVVQVNLTALTQTCTLLAGGGFKPLHSAGSIENAAAHQHKAFAAAQHHASGQQGHGESGNFLTRLFSGSGNSGASNQYSGSVAGATMTIAQRGDSNGAVVITSAGSTLTLSSGALLKSDGTGASRGLILASNTNSNSGSGDSPVRAGSISPILVNSGGLSITSASINSAGTNPAVISSGQFGIAATSSLVVSGSGLVGSITPITTGAVLNLNNAGAGSVLVINGAHPVITGTTGGATPP